jgi:hypothetical protein
MLKSRPALNNFIWDVKKNQASLNNFTWDVEEQASPKIFPVEKQKQRPPEILKEQIQPFYI